MCRLFGLIANKEVDIKFSMLEAVNNFKNQSQKNPHGWGIGYYKNSKPTVEKYGEQAFNSNRFDALVKEIKSKIFIAHIRFASSGSSHSDYNAHPFIYKTWIFAHNGTINEQRIFELLKAPYNQNFTSEPIDSEIYFRYLMQCIEETRSIYKGIKVAVNEVVKDSIGANFLLTDGKKLFAFRYGNSLYYLVRNPSFLDAVSDETKALIESKSLSNEKAILISSEKLTNTEPWRGIKNGYLLVCDNNLKYKEEKICQEICQ